MIVHTTCGWCKKDMGTKGEGEETIESHGICDECYRKESDKLELKDEDE